MRGLLAIEPLYHQIVAGNKTQTRRSGGLEEVNKNPDNWEITGQTGEDNELEEVDFCDYKDTQRNIYCKPRYRVGEILYLKEPYIVLEPPGSYAYRFSKEHSYIPTICFKNKLFMPASAARVFIQITGIKCERLLDISDEDCIAEGIRTRLAEGGIMDKIFKLYPDNGWLLTPRPSFISLYRFANKISPKKDIGNPWVFAYTFKKVDKP